MLVLTTDDVGLEQLYVSAPRGYMSTTEQADDSRALCEIAGDTVSCLNDTMRTRCGWYYDQELEGVI